jgi:DNA-binding transcriptional LysR family regulator
VDIRQLGYLIALARERHFARAADACHVTQPTLSGRIKQLEEELGVALVQRGRRYAGLTPEGERVLRWARRVVEDVEGMRQDLAALSGEPAGCIRLGAIPSAMPWVAALTRQVLSRHPKVQFTILSRSAAQIAREVEERALDAGLTYLDGAEAAAHPLYPERYRLFLRDDHPLAGNTAIAWTEAAATPLCALTTDMRNRLIIDTAFAEAGCAPAYAVESNSVIALFGHLETGAFAAVLPEVFLRLFGRSDRIRAIPMAHPREEPQVGLLLADRDPQPVLVSALLAAAKAAPSPEAWIGVDSSSSAGPMQP